MNEETTGNNFLQSQMLKNTKTRNFGSHNVILVTGWWQTLASRSLLAV